MLGGACVGLPLVFFFWVCVCVCVSAEMSGEEEDGATKPLKIIHPRDMCCAPAFQPCDFCNQETRAFEYDPDPVYGALVWGVCKSDWCARSVERSYAEYLRTNPMDCMAWLFRVTDLPPHFAWRRTRQLHAVTAFAPLFVLSQIECDPMIVCVDFGTDSSKTVSLRNVVHSTLAKAGRLGADARAAVADWIRRLEALDATNCDDCIPPTMGLRWQAGFIRKDSARKGILNSARTFTDILKNRLGSLDFLDSDENLWE